MAILVSSILESVALRTGDPEFKRTTREQMLMIYNQTINDVASKVECLERDSTFDITASVARYPYPADAVVITGVQYTPDPVGDPNVFSWLGEVFTDEERRLNERRSSSGTPSWYRARRQHFQIGPIPDASITKGGLVEYIHIPARLLSEVDQSMQLPDFLWSYVEDGMIPRLLRLDNQHAAASAAYTVWAAQAADYRSIIEDRSRDRRSAIRVGNNPYGGMR